MSQYKNYGFDQLDELLSQFLINSWSYSKVTTFSRNEKAFEMNYVFGINSKRSATTVAGEAYHAALDYYFQQKKEGNQLQLVDLEIAAFDYINTVPGNRWKIQKTTPTVNECIQKAVTSVTSLLKNFYEEKGVYEDDIKRVLEVEVQANEFLTVNGVDIPLPCHARIDLVVESNDDQVIIIDHKSKSSFTSEEEIALSIGVQAMTYVLCYESKFNKHVEQVWFVENKVSKNRDGSPQLSAFKITMDENSRRLYESLLYEPLKRMVSAVNDPDYVYLINNADNYVDKAELYDFWCRTMICEVEDFNVEESKKALISQRLKKIRDASSLATVSPNVIKRFRENAATFIQYDLSSTNMTTEQKIEHSLRTFGIVVKVAHVLQGYSSDTYLLEFSAGTKLGSVFQHRLDLANALNVENVRIHNDLVVYEGRSYMAVDAAKKNNTILYLDRKALVDRKIPLGVDNFGKVVYWNLDNHSTPHMLICGATGSGKSVCVKSIIEYNSMIPDTHIIIFDPKFEFLSYSNYCDVYNDIEEIEEAMATLVEKMQEMVRKGTKANVLVIFDEFADAVANSRKGNDLKKYDMVIDGYSSKGVPKMKRACVGEDKSLEENLRILLQKGRSSGFRVVAATQRASVKVITGDAKVNFPVQVCFRVPKESDSRVVIDEPGAESLGGMGDGLIKSPEYLQTVRFQAYYFDKNSSKPKTTKKIEIEVEE